MSKRIIISQNNYIPWKGFFDSIASADEYVIYDNVQFTKRDWRNRNRIQTPSGLKWLTIPVQTKGAYLQNIDEVMVQDGDWAEKHWNTLHHNYRRSPQYKTFSSKIKATYEKAQSIDRLTDINEYFLKTILELLNIHVQITRSTGPNKENDPSHRLLDLCLEREASVYLTGPAAKNYINETIFKEADIKLEYLDYSGYPEYPQLNDTFEHGVSILDPLFLLGEAIYKNIKHRPLKSSS